MHVDGIELPIPTWATLPPEQRQRLLEAAERLWRLWPLSRTWESLSEQDRQFAARTCLLVPDEQSADEPTFRCATCCDRGFIARRGKRVQVDAKARWIADCDSVWYCVCESAVVAEAGFWFRHVYEQRGKKHIRSAAKYAEFLSYLRTSEERQGIQIRDAVNAILEGRERMVEEGEPGA